MPSIADMSASSRNLLASWIGERPETVLPVAALRSGVGRVRMLGRPSSPEAALVESPLVPGEPQGFGAAEALIELLSIAGDWTCVELEPELAAAIGDEFSRRWGPSRRVVDVIHRLDHPADVHHHPLVRRLDPADVRQLSRAESDLLPDDEWVVMSAADTGRLFGAVDAGVLVGQSGSMAAGRSFADVGAHVAEGHRRRGIATAAASAACAAVQVAGLTPVWGTGSHNAGSLALAARLGFCEVARLTYLLRGDL